MSSVASAFAVSRGRNMSHIPAERRRCEFGSGKVSDGGAEKQTLDYDLVEVALAFPVEPGGSPSKRVSEHGRCLVLRERWNIQAPSRTPFNHFLSFCPVALRREPSNYTIHHLLNMKNGIKHVLIKPRPKAH